jgi:hypothetical protein
MKRMLKIFLTGAVTAVSVFAAAQSQNQALGDYARAIRKTKPAQSAPAKPRVYENDNLPAASSISVVGEASAPASDSSAPAAKSDDGKGQDGGKADAAREPNSAAAKEDPKDKEKKAPEMKAGQTAEERKMAVDGWQKKLDGQKDKIALLSRELDVLQREYQLKVSEFYSDTARRVQNPNGAFDDDTKYKAQIADKQKALDGAKEELSNMQEEARRSGVPNSVTE